MPQHTVSQTIQVALQHHQAGRLAQAEALYRQVLARQPNHADALHFLGVIAHQAGRNDIAADLIGKAVALNPEYPQAYCNLGNVLRARGQLDEAIAAFRQAIALQPDYPEAHSNLGASLREDKQLEQAIAACQRAIALRPGFAEAHSNLGIALHENRQLGAAVEAYRQAIALRPGFAEAHYNLGTALRDKGLLDEAIAAYRQAIALQPDYPEAHSNLGASLREDKQLGEAIAACRRAIAQRPGFAEAHSNLGIALHENQQLDAALDAYRQAIDLSPGLADVHYNLGTALRDKGLLDEALAAYREALALRPDYAEARCTLAQLLLLQGDFLQGWKEHECRTLCSEFPSPRWSFAQPQWDGSDLSGKMILVHAEQGFGDVFQFIRYVPLVADRGGKVIFGCDPGLRRLLQRTTGISQWVDFGDTLPPFDVHCPLLSLPLAFGTLADTIPRSVPYLHADPDEAERWRKELADGRCHLNVGLAWAGRPTHQNDRNRSLSLSTLAPLAQVKGTRFYSLQKGEAARQAATPPSGMDLVDRTEELKDFADTAALIANLDLVITVDTAVAHLAGAMGKPVWTLLPFVPDWRWLLEREDSPWYPTMRLFRQPSRGDWESVVARVAEALSHWSGG